MWAREWGSVLYRGEVCCKGVGGGLHIHDVMRRYVLISAQIIIIFKHETLQTISYKNTIIIIIMFIVVGFQAIVHLFSES